MDEKKLTKYAIDYLSKFDSTEKNLSNVLKRKILRLKISNLEKNALFKIIESIILKLKNNNFVNDNRYCASKISTLSRAGKSKNFIVNYLIKKGINKFKINENLKLFSDNNFNWELESAKLFVKKKRLLETKYSYEQKLSKMARAGFNYEICKKILN